MSKLKESQTNENCEDFSKMLNDYGLKSIDFTNPIEGSIIEFLENKVIIDIGYKTEGIMSKEELNDWDGSLKYKVGDKVTVICKSKNPKEGYIVVSKKDYDAILGWEKIEKGYETGVQVLGKIIHVNEDHKGFIVDAGVKMFLPMSQFDIKKVKNPKALLGKEYWFRVSRLNKIKETGVLSRRVILEEEREVQIKKTLSELKEGDTIKGVVTSVTDYGGFIDIGGIDGLVHKNDISYGRMTHPKEKLRQGDEITVKILNIDQENRKIALGIKQKFPDPWVDINKKYTIGKRLVAKVTKIVSFGAFIELEEGIEGLLHISDLTWEGKPDTVEDYVAVADKLWVQVIGVDAKEKKIKLGLKHLEIRPEEKYIEKYKTGDIVKGKVKKILKSVVFVELDKSVEGIIKISDIKYFRIESPQEYLKENEEIEAMILSKELDKNYKIKLGLKQMEDLDWKEYFADKKKGTIVKVKVKKILPNGLKVEVSKNIEGFIRISEIDDRRIESEELEKEFKVGDEREGMITIIDAGKKKLNLSFKALKQKREREDIEKYMKSDDIKSVTTVGDLLQNEIDKKK